MGSPFIFFSEYFNWVSLVLALIFFSRFSKSSKWLSCYLVILPFLVLWMNNEAFQLKNNMHLKHVLAHLEISVFSLYYYFLLERKLFRKLIQILFIGFVIFSIIDTLYYEPFSVYPSNIGFVYGLMIILYSLLFFFEIYEKGDVLYIERHPHFWINSALIIYYSGTLILGLFVNYLMYRIPREKFLYLDEFFSAMTIVFNVLVCIGLSVEAYQNKKIIQKKRH
ncbi:MAG: hypothetical protein RI922_1630 [Bacteroidota bacterium]